MSDRLTIELNEDETLAVVLDYVSRHPERIAQHLASNNLSALLAALP